MVYKTKKETVRKYYKYQYSSWTQPALSANGILGGDSSACACSLNNTGSNYLYKAFDNNLNTVFQSVSNTSNPQWVTFYSPVELNVKEIHIYQNSTESYYYSRGITVQGSNNNSTWTDLATWSRSSYINNFYIDLSSNNSYYKYYRLYVTSRSYFDASNAYLMFKDILFTATQRTVIESTSSDYDFYKDIDVYSLPKTSNSYKAMSVPITYFAWSSENVIVYTKTTNPSASTTLYSFNSTTGEMLEDTTYYIYSVPDNNRILLSFTSYSIRFYCTRTPSLDK